MVNMSSSPSDMLLAIFHMVLSLFALSDLKRFVFHVHVSRVDRAPISLDIDATSTLWYPILFGIVFNIFIGIFCSVNIHALLWHRRSSRPLILSTFALLFLFTIRFVVNLFVTSRRDGLATPTLVERSFFAPSLSLTEELTTLTLDWIIRIIVLVSTLIYHYRQGKKQINLERQFEIPLISASDDHSGLNE